jgi:hypothetical protein
MTEKEMMDKIYNLLLDSDSISRDTLSELIYTCISAYLWGNKSCKWCPQNCEIDESATCAGYQPYATKVIELTKNINKKIEEALND